MPWNCEVPLQHGKLLTDGSGGVVEISPEAAGVKLVFSRRQWLWAYSDENVWLGSLLQPLMSLPSWVRNGTVSKRGRMCPL